MINVFLSASVPLPERDRKFFESADVFLIREAIRALIEVIIPNGTITFGGHPAISPLVSLYLANSGFSGERVTMFQSELFPRTVRDAAINFAEVRYTPAQGGLGASLTHMRQEMIGSADFGAAVIIGGMEGIFEEIELFRQSHPRAKILPVPSTGAAAQLIYAQGGYSEDLAGEISFASMFRRHLLPPPTPAGNDAALEQ